MASLVSVLGNLVQTVVVVVILVWYLSVRLARLEAHVDHLRIQQQVMCQELLRRLGGDG